MGLVCDQRTLLPSYVSGFRFYRGFLLPFLMTLRKVAANVSHHLQDLGLVQRLLLSLNFKYLNLFPRLFIWGCVFQSTSIWAAFVRFFGCSSRFQKDYSRNLPDSLLFRHTFRKGYFCIKFNFDTDMYGTFGASMVSSMLGQKINKCLSDQYNTKNFVCQHIHIIILYNGLPVHFKVQKING